MSTRHQPQQSVSSPAAESEALCQPLSPCITPPNTHCCCTELQTQAVGSQPVLGTQALLPVPSSAHASLQQLRARHCFPQGQRNHSQGVSAGCSSERKDKSQLGDSAVGSQPWEPPTHREAVGICPIFYPELSSCHKTPLIIP